MNTAKFPGRTIGFFTLVSLGLNTIIGSSIFRVPSELARDLNTLSLFAFAFGALLLAPVALSFAEAGSMFGESGGSFVHAKAAFGPRVATAVGFSIWIATILTFATASVASAETVSALLSLPPSAARLVAAAIVLAFSGANLGEFAGGRASALFAAVKLAPLVLIALFAARLQPAWSSAPPLQTGTFGSSLLVVFFALSGFESSAIPSGDSKNAASHVPRAVLLSLALTTLLYTALQYAVLSVPGARDTPTPLATVATSLWGSRAGTATSVLGAISMGGLASAMIFNSPRVLESVYPSAFQRRTALALSALLTLLLTSTLNFRSLIDFTSVTLGVQYIATCAAVIVLRKRQPDRVRHFRLSSGVWIPLLGILSTLWVLAHASLFEAALGALTLLASQFFYRPRAAPP